ncbi:hypothetical protein PCIT_b1139 [Pseudoalteromonas citrea]|uniref:Uncharacterized protein n=1 Tax=Pseudoalteromonas citrea TaxID=43655 RepID=A0AAD4FQD3_9GAMM|nr:hypothetical protein [Pseudoalteromonas citrea]KAF7765015.1 hypothetical protein PCIT_b1139 [Pseudoalteromonas citrea]
MIKLNKKKLKNLSLREQKINVELTVKVVGGFSAMGCGPISNPDYSCPATIYGETCLHD